jgi:membrane protease subunit HflK
MKRLAVLLPLVLIIVASLASAVTQIQPGERGVVRRFGRVVDKPGPGLYLGLPWGMDRVDRVPVDRERRIIVGFDSRDQEDGDQERMPDGQLLTGDHNLINLRVEINYTIDAEQVDKFVLQANQVDSLLVRAAESALAEWVAARNVDDVLLRGKQLLPAWLVAEMSSRLLAYDLGINVGKASVAFLSPPAEVKNAFAEVARAETEIKTKENQAYQEADRRDREARGEIFHKEQMTAAYRQEQYLKARAEAMNFDKSVEQYRRLSKKDPRYLAGVWQDEMGRLFMRMRQNGRLDMLDRYLSADGLDITQVPIMPKKR